MRERKRKMSMRAAVLALTWIGLVLTILIDARPADAQMLSVVPTRVVLEGRQRTAELRLLNHGNETLTYRISFERIRMTDTGALQVIEEPAEGELFADAFIRFSPRQVVLEPGGTQHVRLLARKPADLPDGEYRINLLFTSLPNPDAAPVAMASGDDQIQVNVQVLSAVSIPVIVRHGELSASIELPRAQLRQDEAGTRVEFELARYGERSIRGDMEAVFVPDGGGTPVLVGRREGVVVYTPIALFRGVMSLRLPEGMSLEGGRLIVSYKERGGEKHAPRAQHELRLP